MVPIVTSPSDIVCATFAGNIAFHSVSSACKRLVGCRHSAKFGSYDCNGKSEYDFKNVIWWLCSDRLGAMSPCASGAWTYALKSCLLMNTMLMPVTHAMRFRTRMPYANANIDEFKTNAGNFRSDVLSSHRPQIKFGFVLRNCKKKKKIGFANDEEKWIEEEGDYIKRRLMNCKSIDAYGRMRVCAHTRLCMLCAACANLILLCFALRAAHRIPNCAFCYYLINEYRRSAAYNQSFHTIFIVSNVFAKPFDDLLVRRRYQHKYVHCLIHVEQLHEIVKM